MKVVASVTKLTNSQLKAIALYKRRIIEHEIKLANYIKDPLKFDNLGYLKNEPSEIVKEKIIQTRINHLTNEIQIFKNNIEKILNGK